MRDDFVGFVGWASCPSLVFPGGQDAHPTRIIPSFNFKEYLEIIVFIVHGVSINLLIILSKAVSIGNLLGNLKIT